MKNQPKHQWQGDPGVAVGHAVYCQSPHHSLTTYCTSAIAGSAEPSLAWRQDHYEPLGPSYVMKDEEGQWWAYQPTIFEAPCEQCDKREASHARTLLHSPFAGRQPVLTYHCQNCIDAAIDHTAPGEQWFIEEVAQ